MEEIINVTQNLNLAFINLDLLSVGVTVAAITLLGFIVYISNSKSITSIFFLLFCIATILWSSFNYVSYRVKDPEMMLHLWRAVIFLGFWQSFTFFNFLYVFPKEKVTFPRWYTHFLTPYIVIVSLWTLLGNFVFSGVNMAALNNSSELIVEKGIIIFGITGGSLVLGGFAFLIRRIIKDKKSERRPYFLILIGAGITFFLLFIFNLILPTVFKVIRFIPLGAVTMLPFAAFTTFAISRHKTFKVKHMAPSLMAFFLCVSTFVEIVFAENYGQLILRSGIFLFVLLISIQFVKNIFILESITERLEKANVDLKSLDVLKSEFISLASHQLRSPLTVIKGYASTLTDGIVGELNPKQSEIVNHIYSSAQSLASMVEEFLNVSKIEQGGMKYSFESVDVSALVASLADEMKRTAEDKHLAFSITGVTDGVCMVQADTVKLRQVFLNLIDNSIKYTQEGFVHVSLEKKISTKDVIITISDSGIGISEDTKKKLFTKFGRGEEVSSHSGGSGLGLYLAQEVVKAHHGTIHAQSKGLHLGASFSVVLPLTV